MDDDKAILTIYTDKYDSQEDVVNGGMSGKAFIDNLPEGTGVEFKCIDDALQFANDTGIEIGRIDLHYLDNGGCQSFWKFNIA